MSCAAARPSMTSRAIVPAAPPAPTRCRRDRHRLSYPRRSRAPAALGARASARRATHRHWRPEGLPAQPPNESPPQRWACRASVGVGGGFPPVGGNTIRGADPKRAKSGVRCGTLLSKGKVEADVEAQSRCRSPRTSFASAPTPRRPTRHTRAIFDDPYLRSISDNERHN